ncbi:MAG: DUF1956 domain-containing protein [Desulfobulbaceae bacterium]|nr:MAG: DUF1956 domain-containing protein [Desulfobulbaceae bacterium]
MSDQTSTDTREKLFAAGIKIFADKGYTEATVREICKVAQSSNINAINYYFGSKEGLYKEILEKIFSSYDQFDQADWDRKTPEQQLRMMINNFCAMLYRNNNFRSDITAIFIKEMTCPSPFLEEMVDDYNRPRVKRHLLMFQNLLGEGATEDMARDCLVSVAGQLLYYSFAWPVFSRLFPDYSPEQNYLSWADHVYDFSLGGIEAMKKNVHGGSSL